jgi:hypothetical protein
MANSTDSTSSRRSEMTFCVSSLRIEIYLCGCLQDEMRRVYSWGGGERNETKTKWRGGKLNTERKREVEASNNNERQKHFSIINKANKRQMKMGKNSGGKLKTRENSAEAFTFNSCFHFSFSRLKTRTRTSQAPLMASTEMAFSLLLLALPRSSSSQKLESSPYIVVVVFGHVQKNQH